MVRTTLWLAVLGAAASVGLVLRMWLLYHRPLTSDEAVVGLMARQIRHGQVFTFFWGQAYGGAEPYVVAVWTAFAGSGPVSLNAVPTVLAGLSAVLVWRIARRLLPADMGLLAASAGTAVWVWPDVMLYDSTRELGFRGVTLLAGLGVLVMALRSAETASAPNLGGLGLIAGIGWWSSPEIIYFVIPALMILVARRSSIRRARPRSVALGVGAALLGAAPWLATNLRTGFLSLKVSSSPDYVHSTYTGRLSIFFAKTLPMDFGLRAPLTGAWLWGRAGQVIYVLAVAALVLLCIAALTLARKGDPTAGVRSIAAGVLIFPMVYAVFPATSYWQEGQYSIFLIPLVTLGAIGAAGVWVAGPGASRRRQHRGRGTGLVLPIIVVVAAAVVSVASFDRSWLAGHPGRFLVAWNGPSTTAEEAAHLIEGAGIRNAYAEYWVAYDLDYLGRGRLAVTDPYTDRWVAENNRVLAAPDPAWIFFPPAQMSGAEAAFSSVAPGPFGYSESYFLAKLQGLGVSWTVEHLGVLDVVVPARTVTPSEVGIPAPLWR